MRYKLPWKLAPVLLVLCALLLGAWSSSRWLPARVWRDRAGSTSPLVVLSCTQRDLGTLHQGDLRRAEFSISNAGGRRLVLRELGTGCCGGSTNPPPVIVPPGGSADLVVPIDASRWHGRMRHTVHYATNDPQRPHFALVVEANVES